MAFSESTYASYEKIDSRSSGTSSSGNLWNYYRPGSGRHDDQNDRLNLQDASGRVLLAVDISEYSTFHFITNLAK